MIVNRHLTELNCRLIDYQIRRRCKDPQLYSCYLVNTATKIKQNQIYHTMTHVLNSIQSTYTFMSVNLS